MDVYFVIGFSCMIFIAIAFMVLLYFLVKKFDILVIPIVFLTISVAAIIVENKENISNFGKNIIAIISKEEIRNDK